MLNSELKNYSQKALEAAQIAGKIHLKHFSHLKSIKDKDYEGDLVTEADNEAEKSVLEYLKSHFKNHGFIGEEGSSKDQNTEYTWVIDPLDGTVNYAHQFPFFAVSIALMHNKNPIVGVIYNPYFDELFQAELGCGARLNGVSIKVSETSALPKSLLASGFAYDRRETKDNNYFEFCHLTNITHGVRRLGSAALDLAYVACGRLDGYWERGIKVWDIAAGSLIVKEAGGKISAYDSSELDIFSGRILATNGKIHKSLSEELIKIKNIK